MAAIFCPHGPNLAGREEEKERERGRPGNEARLYL